MANSGNVLGQIGESFETLGEDVVREAVQAPKDMVGSALESVGLKSGKKGQKQQTATQTNPADQAAAQHTAEINRAVARRALEEISGNRPKQKEPTVWETIQQEEEQKKLMAKKQKEESRKNSVPQVSSKRKRGDLYGKKAKKTQMENKSIRQD